MFREISTVISRLTTGRLSGNLVARHGVRLDTDELSAHMLRDLGLADGHALPMAVEQTQEADLSRRHERLILMPFAS